MKSRSNLGERIDNGLRAFARQLADKSNLQDGALTTRIVGEFSAGKTRLLRELLGDLVPQPLAPISSRDVQTRLPLELTYGTMPQLSVVKRAYDTQQGEVVEVLEQFPLREQIEARAYSPELHRLRLSLPLEQLILHEGDGYHDGKQARRLFLIDMPGWNSGEDEIAEQDADIVLNAELSLSLVYVTPSTRLDSAINRQRLRDFLTVLSESEFLSAPKLLMVVTHCGSAEEPRMSSLARELVDNLWREVGEFAGDLSLDVLCADFNHMNEVQKQLFRGRFWQCLLAPLGQQDAPIHPWVSQIRQWPSAWDIRPRLVQTHALFAGLRALAGAVQRDGQFLRGMNRHRLVGLDEAGVRLKLHDAWRRQTGFSGFDEIDAALTNLALDADHPLSDWWQGVWLDQVKLTFGMVRTFFTLAQRALDGITAQTIDIEAYLQRELHKHYTLMQLALASSFARLVDTATTLASHEAEQALATLLTLSAMQGRYESQYKARLQSLRDDVTA